MSKYNSIDQYINSLQKTLTEVKCNQKPEIFEIISAIQKAKEYNKTIFVFGNGGSSATASHFACDLTKFIGVKVMCLSDNTPSVLAIANDKSYDDIFVEQLKIFMGSGDVVIGFSGSGMSKNVLKAFDYSRDIAVTIGITGFDGGLLKLNADICLIVPNNNIQQIEDIHLMITHLVMTVIRNQAKL